MRPCGTDSGRIRGLRHAKYARQYYFMKRDAEIDGIRGLAILAVITAHWIADPFRSDITRLFGAESASAIGSLVYGVDVFFLVSGYLIGGIIFKGCNQKYFAVRFLARRALRIMPLYYLCVLIFGALVAYVGAYPDTAPPVWVYLLFLQDISTDRPTLIFNPYWSIAVELQFYVAAGLLAAITGRRGVVAFGVLLMLVSPPMRATAAYWDVPFWTFPLCRSDAIGLGVLIAADRSGRATMALSAVWAALGLVAADMSMIVAGIAGLVLASRDSRLLAPMLSPGWLRLCGRMCLSLYLLHQAVLFGLVLATGSLNPSLPAVLVAFAALVLLCVVIERGIPALLSAASGRLRRQPAGLRQDPAIGAPGLLDPLHGA